MKDFSVSSLLNCDNDIERYADDDHCISVKECNLDEPLTHKLLLSCTSIHKDFADFEDSLLLHQYLTKKRASREPLSAEHISVIAEQMLDVLVYLHLSFKLQGAVINGCLSTPIILIDYHMNIHMLLPSMSRSRIEKWLYSDAPELVIPNRYIAHKNTYISVQNSTYGRLGRFF